LLLVLHGDVGIAVLIGHAVSLVMGTTVLAPCGTQKTTAQTRDNYEYEDDNVQQYHRARFLTLCTIIRTFSVAVAMRKPKWKDSASASTSRASGMIGSTAAISSCFNMGALLQEY
jgi:hypothetical protein